MVNGTYRRDIDGLRGIAILIVIIYHAFPTLLPAGFIGVDIFFVISGYLITGIILEQRQHNKFSYREFYRRRILRLAPALLALLLSCLLLGWFVLLPSEFRELNKHIGGSAVFLNNFILLYESGYFESSIQNKPLMHLWSLGVEEQFYLIWPVLMLQLLKRQQLLFGIAVLGICSLALCLYIHNIQPDNAFYLPTSRLWQLLIGATVAHFHFQNNIPTKSRTDILGILLLASALALINNSNYPNWAAVLPTLAAACFIHSPQGCINTHILSHKILVAVGKLSYSLYLWHWPLLAFVFISFGSQANIYLLAIALIIGILCSVASYYLIEKPARYSQQLPTSLLLFSLLALSIFGFANYQHSFIFPNRTVFADENTREGKFYIKAHRDPIFFASQFDQREALTSTEHCLFAQSEIVKLNTLKSKDPCLQIPSGKHSALVIGDSFASDTYASLKQHLPNTHFIHIPSNRCQVSNYFYLDRSSDCSEYIRTSQITTIIIAMQWNGYHKDLQNDLAALINDGHNIIIIGPGVEFNDWVYNLFTQRKNNATQAEIIGQYMRFERFALNTEMKTHYEKRGITYIDRLAMFCSSPSECQLFDSKGNPYIVDWGHLFPAGIDFFGQQLAKHAALQHLH